MNEGSFLYHYRAHITSVYDGDTCTATIDLGFNLKQGKIKLRLHGIDAPEIRGETKEKGRESRDYLRKLVLDKPVEIQTFKDKKGKYGRYIAQIWIELDGSKQCVNDLLVINGYAEQRQY